MEAYETLARCILCESTEIRPLCHQNRFDICKSCGHIFDNPRLTQQSIIDHYGEPDQYNEWLGQERARQDLHRRRLKKIRKHISKGALLDVGAGIGEFQSVAQQYFEVIGTEISKRAVEIARNKYDTELREGEFESMQFERSFDLITMFHVLEHVPNPSRTLERCYQILKPNGLLVLAVPNDVDSILTRRNRLCRKLGLKKYLPLGELGLPALTSDMGEIHLSHFKQPQLESSLLSHGFVIEESSLDPYFSVLGTRRVRRYLRLWFYQMVFLLTGRNLYDAIWIVARKTEGAGRENLLV